MKNTYHKFFKNRIIIVFLFLLTFQFSYSQLFSGPTSVQPNGSYLYQYDDSNIYTFASWQITGGTLVSSSKEGTLYMAMIQWGPAGYGSVTFRNKGLILGTKNVTIGTPPPATPDLPTITNNCNSTRLTRGTPPSGEVWYWQSSSLGTSTSNSSINVDRTSGSIYYLRSYKSSTSLWSTARTINYTVTQDTCGLSNENYIHTITPTFPTTDTSLLNANVKIESVTYFDGLGRPMQLIGMRAGGNNEDIITHIEYDNFGNQVNEYLPYTLAQNNGIYNSDSFVATKNYYNLTKYEDDFPGMNTTTINPYSQKSLEKSPLNRVEKQAAPGMDWKLGNGNEIEFEYDINTDIEVKKYYVTLTFANNTFTPTLELNTTVNNGNYYANELYKTVTRDENHTSGTEHTSEEFKDKQGRVILKRTYGASNIGGSVVNNAPHDTYYVYDDYGNLTYVLPPKSEPHSAKPSSTELSELCYQYKYDDRNRLVEKKMPGKDLEHIVYDNLDRPVLTQDGRQRKANNSINNTNLTTDQWLFTKYDVLGRIIFTGIYSSDTQRSSLQSIFNNKSSASDNYETKVSSGSGYAGTYYTNVDFPLTSLEVLTINYYDNFTFNRAGGGTSAVSYGITTSSNVKGLATGARVKVLGTSNWITTILYYDDKARSIYNYSNNDFLNTTDIVKTHLDDFNGRVLETETTHIKVGKLDLVITDKFYYDHLGRLTQQTNKVLTENEELIVENTYDELGQLTIKKIGNEASSSTRLQTVDYTYNVRGWLKGINNTSGSNSGITLGTDDLFGFQINYNSPSSGIALYNGNISQTLWKSTSINPNPPNNPISTRYNYTYDALNRITSGIDNTTNQNYSLQNVSYDKNGNIQSLLRRGHTVIDGNGIVTGFGVMDNLSYDYDSGNKLINVTEQSGASMQYGFNDVNVSGNDYNYDANGNLILDVNKGITNIDYNILNLPVQVSINGQNISYIYDATGTKLQKTVGNTVTDYAGNYVYENDDLQFFNTLEGYITPINSTNYNSGFNYIYQYKDHIGNIRLSYSDFDGNGEIAASSEIIKENNYYPFGLRHEGYNFNSIADHNWDYQGKENLKELGLNWHDFGARNYDAAIGRWINIDPLTDKFYDNSSYNSMINNPINFVDPDGMAAMWVPKLNENGSTSYIAERGDSASTLSSQYGISQNEAEAITGTQGDNKIAQGTEISGAVVNNVTGSEALKLDLNSKEGKSEQRRFDQFLYARDRSNSKGANSFLSTDYYSNNGMNEMMEGNAVMNLGGQEVSLHYNIPMYRPGSFDNSSTATRLSNAPITTKQRGGLYFGVNQEHIVIPMYHPDTGKSSGDNFYLSFHTKSVNKAWNRLNKSFPEFHYIRVPQVNKN